jgi:hypothetical protein
MRAAEFYRAVTMDRADLLDRMLALFEREGIRYCIIGGLAVNAYVEPLISLDLDVAVAPEQLSRVEALLAGEFDVAEFPHSFNVSDADSSLRVQIQRDERYGAFVARSQVRDVLGTPMSVASVEDVLQGKIWAASDPERRESKRKKDLLDIARLIEAFPALRERVPAEVLERLI